MLKLNNMRQFKLEKMRVKTTFANSKPRNDLQRQTIQQYGKMKTKPLDRIQQSLIQNMRG